MRLGIFGAGGLALEVYDTAIYINRIYKNWTDIFFVEDEPSELAYHGCPLISTDTLLSENDNSIIENTKIVIAVGEINFRSSIVERIRNHGYCFENLIHPLALVSPSAKIGTGVVVQAFTIISSKTQLGDYSYIHPHCIIGHGATIGVFTMISSGVNIGGNTKIGASTFIGMNATVFQSVRIGDNSLISAGALLSSDIESGYVVAGNPARIIKKNEKNSKIF
jgi:sugar O-acyltransferase (sialic acid O-acetyltransferase NeuD family)